MKNFYFGWIFSHKLLAIIISTLYDFILNVNYVNPLYNTENSKAIIWGMQNRAVQGMLDFDFCCSRKTPSVVAMTYPFRYAFIILMS